MKYQGRMLRLILLSMVVFLSNIGNAQTDYKQIRRIESAIENVMQLSDCPGMSVAVVQKGQLIYAKGFGFGDVENKKPATANTLFAIGSCSKSFTAALIGQLENQKKIDLDERPRTYLPNLIFYNDEMNNQVTIRDMLCHRTGLPRHDLSWYLFPSNSRDSLISRIRYHEPSYHVRERYQYNNFMYMVTGAIVEKLSGNTWDENVVNRIFTPLGMTRSTTGIAGLKNRDDVAFGYSYKKKMRVDEYDIKGMSPAGGIYSSALDMSHWLMAWMQGGNYEGKEVIPSEFVSKAIGSQMVVSSRIPGGNHPDLHLTNYGFAWDLSSYRGHYRVEHGGNIDGFSASVCFFPSDSIGIVVLVNQNFSGVPALVRNMIADKLLELESANWDEPLKKAKKAEKTETEDRVGEVSKQIPGSRYSHDLKSYAGLYSQKGYGTFQIVMKEDSLFAHFPTRKYWLRHNYYDIFEPFTVKNQVLDTSFGAGFYLNFQTAMNGDIEGVYIDLEGSLDPLLFEREFVPLELESAALTPYLGNYSMNGRTIKLFINEEASLTMLVPGQPEYVLVPSGEDLFKLKELDGFSVKFERENGITVALILQQPNGNFRVPKQD